MLSSNEILSADREALELAQTYHHTNQSVVAILLGLAGTFYSNLKLVAAERCARWACNSVLVKLSSLSNVGKPSAPILHCKEI